jgi:hypothetical protein
MIKIIIYDSEIFVNYWLVAFQDLESRKIVFFEMRGSDTVITPDQKKRALSIFTKRETVSYNGSGFDEPMVKAWLDGWSVERLKSLCNSIITAGGPRRPQWRLIKEEKITDYYLGSTIDLMEVSPGVAIGLKVYAGRMHSRQLQDLPYAHDALLTEAEMDDVRDYCCVDLRVTGELFTMIERDVQLRRDMSEEYGVNLISKSDSQIAEAVLKHQMIKLGSDPKKLKAPKLKDGWTYNYKVPSFVKFNNPKLQEILEVVRTAEFTLSPNGSPKMPQSLTRAKITIGSSTYKLGMGGLHSNEKNQVIEANKTKRICDIDVASYYPRTILTQRLYPPTCGPNFLKVYQGIVDDRLEAKRTGDKVRDASNKVVINSSFGKMGSKYSCLYAPDLLLQVTITGQLALLMLIEWMEDAGIEVKSANTDGIVCLFDRDQDHIFKSVILDWELTCDYTLEETEYEALVSRDVNNYFAVKPDGQVKTKGVFANDNPLAKNPFGAVSYNAVIHYFMTGTDPGIWIPNQGDIKQFILLRSVTGGAVWRDLKLGKVVRWVYSTDGEAITYKLNGNKVASSDGAHPVMDLDEKRPAIDYDKYVLLANKLIFSLGL